MSRPMNASTVDMVEERRIFSSEVTTQDNVRVAFEFRDPFPIDRSLTINVDWDNDGQFDQTYEGGRDLIGSKGDFVKEIISDGDFTEVEAQDMLDRFGLRRPESLDIGR